MKIYIMLVYLFCCSISGFSQAGKNTGITGKIIDAKTGESMPGATIQIRGTTIGTTTDLDGVFTIRNVAEGNYVLEIRMISYNPKIIQDVIVSGNSLTSLTISIEQTSTALSEVVVVATAKRESINALLIEQKNSTRVSDGISAESIKKTPDKNTSEVLKRVSGTTIQDNKFAIIRGLNERYNQAFLNGAPLPSSESDRKAFSFEIFPASLLDNITVVKSATADLPADFSGGTIIINTKSVPEENEQSISFSTGYNTLATGKKFYTYKGGKYDWIGIDDGSRSLPKGLPETQEFRKLPNGDKAELAKLMPNDWALKQTKASAPLSFQYSLAHSLNFKKVKLGAVFALTYNRSYKITCSVRREFDESVENEKPQQTIELNDTDYSEQILSGGILNLSAKIGKANTISFKNMYNINSEDKVVRRDGISDYSSTIHVENVSSVRSFTQNQLLSSQLEGEHLLPFANIRVKWSGGYSEVQRSIPNLRTMIYTRSIDTEANPEDTEPVFEAAIPTSGTSPSSAGNIFYSKTNEKIYSGTLELNIPVKLPVKTGIKAGIYYQERSRDFASRQFGFSRYSQGSKIIFNKQLVTLPEELIFAEAHQGIIFPHTPATPTSLAKRGLGGFKLEEATKLNDTYFAASVSQAAYLMLDHKFFDKLRVVYGGRLEQYNQRLDSFEDDGDTITVDTTQIEFLPSATIIYSLTDKSNLRASYAETVSRPEFRELAPFGFFDFVTFYSVRGNPDLKTALIDNYDLRYEYYPGRSQMFSVSLFYKVFYNAIERINRADVARELYYQNVPLVNSYGAELEYRFNLGALLKKDENKFLASFNVFSNLAYIFSEVRLDSAAGIRATTRPLQGQSPYIVNGGLQYSSVEYGFSLSAGINRIGRRISIVGNRQEPDIYENPRTVIDVQLAKMFYKKLELKFTVKDFLSEDVVFYQDINNDGRMSRGIDNLMSESITAVNYGFIIGYKF